MAFPVLPSGAKPDSKGFSETLEDVSMSKDTEGGYTYTRPKHTRSPRRSFVVPYVSLTDADKLAIENHWNSVKGGSLIFDWTHPKTGVVYAVRYQMSELDFRYTGVGTAFLWDCELELKQA